MTDLIDNLFEKVGFTGSDLTAFQFIVGLGLVTFSLIKYTEKYAAIFIIGILFGGYLILKAVK